jgi:hypothetical protein
MDRDSYLVLAATATADRTNSLRVGDLGHCARKMSDAIIMTAGRGRTWETPVFA